MEEELIRALVAPIKTGGFINVTCQRNTLPPVVQIDMPFGLSISIDYNLYQQIRQAAGLPEGVCD